MRINYRYRDQSITPMKQARGLVEEKEGGYAYQSFIAYRLRPVGSGDGRKVTID